MTPERRRTAAPPAYVPDLTPLNYGLAWDYIRGLHSDRECLHDCVVQCAALCTNSSHRPASPLSINVRDKESPARMTDSIHVIRIKKWRGQVGQTRSMPSTNYSSSYASSPITHPNSPLHINSHTKDTTEHDSIHAFRTEQSSESNKLN